MCTKKGQTNPLIGQSDQHGRPRQKNLHFQSFSIPLLFPIHQSHAAAAKIIAAVITIADSPAPTPIFRRQRQRKKRHRTPVEPSHASSANQVSDGIWLRSPGWMVVSLPVPVVGAESGDGAVHLVQPVLQSNSAHQNLPMALSWHDVVWQDGPGDQGKAKARQGEAGAGQGKEPCRAPCQLCTYASFCDQTSIRQPAANTPDPTSSLPAVPLYCISLGADRSAGICGGRDGTHRERLLCLSVVALPITIHVDGCQPAASSSCLYDRLSDRHARLA